MSEFNMILISINIGLGLIFFITTACRGDITTALIWLYGMLGWVVAILPK